MGRKPRVYVPGVSVHVIHRGHNRGEIFGDDTDREVFLAFLRTAAGQHRLDVHGFVLMDTHYHLVATPTSKQCLPNAMKELGGRYVDYFNSKYDRIGSLWNGRYRGLLIDDERYWFTCLRYVEHNPVEAQMVPTAEAYRWSSYRFHAFGADVPWLVPHHLYLALGTTPSATGGLSGDVCTNRLHGRDRRVSPRMTR
jgi:putative transposase